MKKLLLISLFFGLQISLCVAQDMDTLSCRNGKKIVGKVVTVGKDKVTYMLLPDSTKLSISAWRLNYIAYPGGTKFDFTDRSGPAKASKSSFFLSFNEGFSVPCATYKDAIVGPHSDIMAAYFPASHVGFTVKAGIDLNSTEYMYTSTNYWGGYYIFQQYLAGITYRTGGKPGYPFIDFIGLLGECSAASPAYEQGGGKNPLTLNTPGTGTGFGYYFGIAFTSNTNRVCSLIFGAGCLGTLFNYSNYTSSVKSYDPFTKINSTTVTKDAKSINLELLQMYFGISFRLKKPNR